MAVMVFTDSENNIWRTVSLTLASTASAAWVWNRRCSWSSRVNAWTTGSIDIVSITIDSDLPSRPRTQRIFGSMWFP